jgi:hypothetical protein
MAGAVMPTYICILLSEDREPVNVAGLDATSIEHAEKAGIGLALAMKSARGYQIWHGGQCLVDVADKHRRVATLITVSRDRRDNDSNPTL